MDDAMGYCSEIVDQHSKPPKPYSTSGSGPVNGQTTINSGGDDQSLCYCARWAVEVGGWVGRLLHGFEYCTAAHASQIQHRVEQP